MDIETPPPNHSRHQLYRLLLLAYPRRFRDACGPEMEAVFDQRQRELAGRGPVAQIRFWIETAADIALSAVPEWLTTATDILRPRSHQLDKGQRMDSLIQDLRYALRTLRRAPLFTVVAAITIGVGIGATTTVFSVANSFLLRAPAGVRASSELVTAHRLAEDGSTFHSFSYPLYTDLQRASSGLTSLAAYGIFPVSVTTADEPQLLLGMIVSGNYFQTIQTRAALGRLLLPSDDRGAGGADPVAVLSYRTWLRRFSGDSSIIGRSILLNRQPFTVVGVAEAGFQGHTVAMDAGVWVPLGMYPQISNGERLDVANSSWLEMIGRRRGSVTATQIGQALTAAAAVNAERPRKIDVRTYAPVPPRRCCRSAAFSHCCSPSAEPCSSSAV